MAYKKAAQNEIEQKQITTLKQKQLNYSTDQKKKKRSVLKHWEREIKQNRDKNENIDEILLYVLHH